MWLKIQHTYSNLYESNFQCLTQKSTHTNTLLHCEAYSSQKTATLEIKQTYDLKKNTDRTSTVGLRMRI